MNHHEQLIHALLSQVIDHAGNAQYACKHDNDWQHEVTTTLWFAQCCQIAAQLDSTTAQKLVSQLNRGMVSIVEIASHLLTLTPNN